eukprot:TRINITY_DN2556_c0_g1_i1.p1 TRINITY_DN2556_c0_g1~~TRINITY_DN2556_c0_g1_i1.p1  ORF type:complete len:297 (-),score=90.60 TRINITY_DN2556_c0_g1_i1:127-1017(-)
MRKFYQEEEQLNEETKLKGYWLTSFMVQFYSRYYTRINRLEAQKKKENRPPSHQSHDNEEDEEEAEDEEADLVGSDFLQRERLQALNKLKREDKSVVRCIHSVFVPQPIPKKKKGETSPEQPSPLPKESFDKENQSAHHPSKKSQSQSQPKQRKPRPKKTNDAVPTPISTSKDNLSTEKIARIPPSRSGPVVQRKRVEFSSEDLSPVPAPSKKKPVQERVLDLDDIFGGNDEDEENEDLDSDLLDNVDEQNQDQTLSPKISRLGKRKIDDSNDDLPPSKRTLSNLPMPLSPQLITD